MDIMRLADGSEFMIKDGASGDEVTIILNGMDVANVLKAMSEANLSNVIILSGGAVSGTFKNKMATSHVDNGDTLTVMISDADLCRYGLVLDGDKRIISAPLQRYAPEGVEIVDELPEGNLTDWLRIDGEYVYDPLPVPEPPEPTHSDTERITALEEDSELMLELTANQEYRLCLMELGLTESEVI